MRSLRHLAETLVVLKGLYNASETQYPEKESARVAPHRENL